MDGIDPEVIEQVAIVLEISSEGDAGTRIEIGSRLAEPAPIHPDDSIEAGEIRDPRRPEEGRARVAVLKQDRRRVLPRIGVVRDVVIVPGAIRTRALRCPAPRRRTQQWHARSVWAAALPGGLREWPRARWPRPSR